MFKTVVIFGQLPYPAAKMSVLLKLCTKYINICCGTKCSTEERNNLDVIWTLAECSVKRMENCTAITRMLTVLLPVMYVRSIEIYEADQHMHTANIGLSYTFHLLHLSPSIAIIIRVRTPWTRYIHLSVEECLCNYTFVLHKQ